MSRPVLGVRTQQALGAMKMVAGTAYKAPPLPTMTSASTTSATELGSGGPFHICFRVHVNSITCSGAKCPFALLYDSKRFQAILSLPAIEVSERLLPLAGLGQLIPFAAAALVRRKRSL